MKKGLFIGLCGSIALTLGAHTSFAQREIVMAKNVSDAKFDVEYTLSDIKNMTNGKEINTATVSPKALKSFNKTFKNATPTWYALDRNYLATFDMNGRKTRALLTKGGYIMYSISYGNESSMPKDVRRIIRSNYIDHNIGNVSEIKVNDKTAWVVNLQDDKEIVLARVLDGGLDELQHFSTVPSQPKKHRRGRVIIPQ